MKNLIAKFKFQDILATLLLFSIIVYFFWVSRPGFNSANAAEIKQILGTTMALIVGFYFGSSKSSAAKDAAISNAIKNQQNE